MQPYANDKRVDEEFDALDYRCANEQEEPRRAAIYTERDLWCAVIVQAFVDMGAIAPATSADVQETPNARGREFYEAVRWLLRDKTDFAYICELAGVCPHIIRHAARMFFVNA